MPVLTLLGAPGNAAPIVWVEPSLERVAPASAPGSLGEIELYAARGEYESFQIIVQAPAGGLTNVGVEAPQLGGPRLTLYREHYVYLTQGTTDWASNRNSPLGPGWYADGLIPFVDPATGQDLVGAALDAVPFDLAAGSNQPIWVDLFVPREAAAGRYQGSFTVSSDQGQVTVPLGLTVWDFTLPLQPSMKSCFLYWNVRDQLEADRELIRHRLMPMSVNPAFERELIDELGLNATNAGFWSGADNQSGTMQPAPSVWEFQQAAAQHQPEVHLYNYTADEIGSNPSLYEPMKEWARNMHAAGIDNLVTMSPVPELYDDGSGTGRSAVDIWVMLPKMYDANRSRVDYVVQKGDEAWSYNCLVQDDYSPKWEIDFAPINYRIQPGFINQSLGLTGLLYWRADLWSWDPWNDVQGYSAGYPGEGMLVYPAQQVGLTGVVGSLRLKWLRDGVDDYEYLELLKQRGLGEWALSVARSVGPDWTDWTRDPNQLEAARRQLGEMLDSLSGPHSVSVTASASPVVVGSGGSCALSATAGDSLGHSIASWSWTDGGAGGAFSPSSSAQNPTYTAPENTTGQDREITLSVTATCGGSPELTGSSSVDLLVRSGGTTLFPDVPADYWAYDAVIACVDAGVVSGYPDGYYRPSLPVRRDQMAAYIARALVGGSQFVPDGPNQPTFPDVPADYWAYDYIEYAVACGIVSGFSSGEYHPDWKVTRAQMAVFVSRSVVDPTGEEGLAGYIPPEVPSFSDVPASSWAYKHIEYTAANGISRGYVDGTFRPTAVCTRDQMAVYVARAFGLL